MSQKTKHQRGRRGSGKAGRKRKKTRQERFGDWRKKRRTKSQWEIDFEKGDDREV